MSTLSTLLSSKTWTLPVDGGVDGTLVIGWSFVFLAYFLHPAIESAYHRLRAYRAWRCIQKRQTVEVTTYSLFAEVFGGRGKWDAGRNITVILAAFSLASWGLELSMDLSSLEGEADLLNRPPPVFLRPDTNDSTTDPWEVSLFSVNRRLTSMPALKFPCLLLVFCIILCFNIVAQEAAGTRKRWKLSHLRPQALSAKTCESHDFTRHGSDFNATMQTCRRGV